MSIQASYDVAPVPSSTNVPPIRSQAARGSHPTSSHVISKYERQFVDEEHIAHYDFVTCRRIINPKDMDFSLLGSLGFLVSLNELFKIVGWVKYMKMDKPMYEIFR